MKAHQLLLACLALAISSCFAFSGQAQTRDEKVRGDREALKDDKSWYYDDLEKGIQAASDSKKPMMVVLRCIP